MTAAGPQEVAVTERSGWRPRLAGAECLIEQRPGVWRRGPLFGVGGIAGNRFGGKTPFCPRRPAGQRPRAGPGGPGRPPGASRSRPCSPAPPAAAGPGRVALQTQGEEARPQPQQERGLAEIPS